MVAIASRAGLTNATIQQRLVPVRLFYVFLMEEGLRESNPTKYTITRAGSLFLRISVRALGRDYLVHQLTRNQSGERPYANGVSQG